jgi:hypothetical protein
MARIQILELPSEEGDDGKTVTPFALIVDRCSGDELRGDFGNDLANFRDMCGARAAIASVGTIDIDTPTTAQIGTVSVKVEPDVSGFEEAVTAAIERAQNAIVDAVTPKPTRIHYGLDEPEPDLPMQEAAQRKRDIIADKP